MNYMEKLKKQSNFYAKFGKAKCVYHLNHPIILLIYQKVYFKTGKLDSSIPSIRISLLQDFAGVFHYEIFRGLLPIKGIKHHIDLVLGASNSNHLTYQSNLKKTKEL